MNDAFREKELSRTTSVENDTNAMIPLFVLTLIALLVIACGRATTDGSTASAKSQTTVTTSSQTTGASQNQSAFDAAKTLSLANDQHPWDRVPKAEPAKPVVANGDAKPPELAQRAVVSCAEQQPNRCVSCCDDFFTFGSEHWDQCVNACPKLGVDTPQQSEY